MQCMSGKGFIAQIYIKDFSELTLKKDAKGKNKCVGAYLNDQHKYI